MAVYTRLERDEIVGFLRHYDVGDLVSFDGIEKGVENTNYKIVTKTGPYILTVYERRVDPADLPFFFAFTDHLLASGLRCPRAIPGKDGKTARDLVGHMAALIGFLDGHDVAPESITPAQCESLGGYLARMHAAALSFDGARENTLSLTGWKTLIDAIGTGADTVEPGLTAMIAAEMAYLEQHWPRTDAMKRAVVHADVFPDNVFFTGDTVSGVIDFYFSCTDFLAYDLALVINAWCFDADHALSAERWAALRRGYERERALDGAERDNLSILCRGAALRILLTRVYAWINHPQGALVRPKDPREYSAKLAWHRHEKIWR